MRIGKSGHRDRFCCFDVDWRGSHVFEPNVSDVVGHWKRSTYVVVDIGGVAVAADMGGK